MAIFLIERDAEMRDDSSLRRRGVEQVLPIAFGPRQALPALALSMTVFAFMAVWAVLLSQSGVSDAVALATIHAGSALGLLTFWRLGRWGRARFDAFGAILLLLAVGLRMHALIDAVFFGTRVEQIYVYPEVPMPADALMLFLKAETITFLGLLLVACSWRLRVGLRVEAHSFLLNFRAVPLNAPLVVYLAALLVDFLIRVLGVSFGALTMFSTTLFMFGVASIYFLSARWEARKSRVAVALALGLPMTILALNKGMKTEMFLPMIPAAVMFWTSYRSVLVRFVLVTAAVIVLTISQLYVFHVRQIAWQGDGVEIMSPITLIQSFMDNLSGIEARDALNAASSRVNMTVAHAVTVTLADHNGLEPGNVFGALPATFVPRFLWPGKPVMQPGAMHTARILGGEVPVSEIRSATAAGFAAELYLGGWWVGVVLGMLAYGYLLASAQSWALRATPGYGHLAFCFLTLYWALRFDESHVVYSYTAVVFMVAFLWALRRVTGAFRLKGSTGVQAGRLRSARR